VVNGPELAQYMRFVRTVPISSDGLVGMLVDSVPDPLMDAWLLTGVVKFSVRQYLTGLELSSIDDVPACVDHRIEHMGRSLAEFIQGVTW